MALDIRLSIACLWFSGITANANIRQRVNLNMSVDTYYVTEQEKLPIETL